MILITTKLHTGAWESNDKSAGDCMVRKMNECLPDPYQHPKGAPFQPHDNLLSRNRDQASLRFEMHRHEQIIGLPSNEYSQNCEGQRSKAQSSRNKRRLVDIRVL